MGYLNDCLDAGCCGVIVCVYCVIPKVVCRPTRPSLNPRAGENPRWASAASYPGPSFVHITGHLGSRSWARAPPGRCPAEGGVQNGCL